MFKKNHWAAGLLLGIAPLLPQAAVYAAEDDACSLRMMAVHGGVSYSHELAVVPGERASYAGPAKKRGRGPQREIIFNALLNEAGKQGFRLDYQVEVADEKGPRPPFQVQGKVPLRPGRQALAASAGGWKYYLKLEGEACEEEFDDPKPGTLTALLKCGRHRYPVSFSYLTNEQYSAVLYSEDGDKVTRFTIGLLPGGGAFDGTFPLQYAVQLKDGGETIADNTGGVLLSPGGGAAKASAGRGCSFTVKAGR
ncbi:MAG TPA: hypothetical protein DDW67_09410 [Elusimicrobia bacterium]|nr:hypothetical protein [Elusimicrobiota bacterium]